MWGLVPWLVGTLGIIHSVVFCGGVCFQAGRLTGWFLKRNCVYCLSTRGNIFLVGESGAVVHRCCFCPLVSLQRHPKVVKFGSCPTTNDVGNAGPDHRRVRITKCYTSLQRWGGIPPPPPPITAVKALKMRETTPPVILTRHASPLLSSIQASEHTGLACFGPKQQ